MKVIFSVQHASQPANRLYTVLSLSSQDISGTRSLTTPPPLKRNNKCYDRSSVDISIPDIYHPHCRIPPRVIEKSTPGRKYYTGVVGFLGQIIRRYTSRIPPRHRLPPGVTSPPQRGYSGKHFVTTPWSFIYYCCIGPQVRYSSAVWPMSHLVTAASPLSGDFHD